MLDYLATLIRHLRGWQRPPPDLPQDPTRAFDNRDGEDLAGASRPWLFRSQRRWWTSTPSRERWQGPTQPEGNPSDPHNTG